MLTRFYHKELEDIKQLQHKLIAVYDLYISNSFSLEPMLMALLEDCLSYYKLRSDEVQITWVQSLMSELTTAKRGINPFTLEKVTIRRNELRTTTCYKIIQNLNEKISTASLTISTVISDAQALLKQIILLALQLEAITPEEIKSVHTQMERSQLWNKLFSINGVLQQHTRKLTVMVSAYDLNILLDQVSLDFQQDTISLLSTA